MTRVHLVHWNSNEAEECAQRIIKLGVQVESIVSDPEGFRAIKHSQPDAVIIDLSRLPSHGRDVGVWLRQTKATRHIPFIFVEGAAEKIERVKQVLPDAPFATYRSLGSRLKKAISKPKSNPVVPKDNLAGYSGTPLPKKLGIKPGMTLHLVNAPPGIEKALTQGVDDVTVKTQLRGTLQLVIWFVTRITDLEKRIDSLADRLGPGSGIWIAWPKKTSGVESDVTQTAVREMGLATGLVDYKICAIDATWSGLKFAPRKAPK